MTTPVTPAPAVDVPIPVVVTRYQCPHCRTTRAKRQATEAHIGRCWKNPAARGCKTCTHYEPPEDGPYPEHPGWPEGCTAERDLGAGLHINCPLWEEPTSAPKAPVEPWEETPAQAAAADRRYWNED